MQGNSWATEYLVSLGDPVAIYDCPELWDVTDTSGNTKYYFSLSEFKKKEKKKVFLSVFGTTRELKSICLAINL